MPGFISNWGFRKRSSDRYAAKRDRALDTLGGAKCVRCSFTDPRALCFDHIADDGSVHRASVGNSLVPWIIANPDEARSRLQVLCSNCNLIKEYERRFALLQPPLEVRPASEGPAHPRRAYHLLRRRSDLG